MKPADPGGAAELAPTRPYASQAAGFLAHANLPHLNPDFEFIGQYFNQFPEIDPVLGGIKEDSLGIIALVFHIIYLHFEAEFECCNPGFVKGIMLVRNSHQPFVDIGLLCFAVQFAQVFFGRVYTFTQHLQPCRFAGKGYNANIVPGQLLARRSGAIQRPIPLDADGQIDLPANSAMLGPRTESAAIAIAVVYVPIFARLIRGPAMVLVESDFVAGIRSIGATDLRIMLRHILPNLASVILVQSSLLLSAAILVEASLSFLGLGTQPPTPSLGLMLAEGRNFVLLSPWNAIFAGLGILLLSLGFNLLGDALRDELDPRLRGQS